MCIIDWRVDSCLVVYCLVYGRSVMDLSVNDNCKFRLNDRVNILDQ